MNRGPRLTDDSTTEPPRHLWSSLQEHARERPDDVAVADSDRFYSWRQLNARATSMSIALASAPNAGTVVMFLPSSIDWIAAFLGSLHTGATSICDGIAISDDELSWLISSCRTRLVLTTHQYFDLAAEVAAAHDVPCITVEDVPESAVASARFAKAVDFDFPAVLHLTSGSSGNRGIVVRSLNNLLTEAWSVASAMTLTADDVVVATSPAYHSWASGVLCACLLRGAAFVTMEPLTTQALFGAIRTYQPTILTGVPYLYQLLGMIKRTADLPFDRLRLPLSGGAFLDPTWNQRASEVLGSTVGQEYGLSEGGITTLNVDNREAKPSSVGYPIPGVRLDIVDPALPTRPLPTGETGEIVVRRPHSPVEYLGDPEASKWTFFAADAVRTGDLGYLDEDGSLFVVGRSKLMINVAGAKVAPREVEAVLLRCEGVLDAVVVPRQDALLGETVGAIVATRGGVTEADVVQQCQRSLSAYKVPRIVHIVEDMPRTGSGKIDRAQLAQLINGLTHTRTGGS